MNMKRKYVTPTITATIIELEQGIAAGSSITIGGTNNNPQPDILDQDIEEQFYDLEF